MSGSVKSNAPASAPEIAVKSSFLATVFSAVGLNHGSPFWELVDPPKSVAQALASGAGDAVATRVVDKLTRLTLHKWVGMIPMFGGAIAGIANVNRILNCTVAMFIYLACVLQDMYCQRQVDAGVKEVYRPIPYALYAFALMVLRREGGTLADSFMGWALRIWAQARAEIKEEHGADPLGAVSGLGLDQ
jgi:hypothetical protein